MKLIEKVALSFDDISLVPQKSKISSRYSNEIDISQYFGSARVSLPIINAPMDMVVSYSLCKCLVENGGIALVHRFMTPLEQSDFYEALHYGIGKENGESNFSVGIALGVRDWKERVERTYSIGCRLYCIDVAHGHHENVLNLAREIPTEKLDSPFSLPIP